MSGGRKLSPPGERIMTGGAGPSSGPASGPGGGIAACAACKYQRRKCATDCPLAPYFPPDQPKRFLNVHKLFGVSSILRILRQVDPDKREDTVKSIVYEADTREKDPVHGCLGVINLLQNQVNKLKNELSLARDQLYLLEQQHASSILQQTYAPQHAGGQTGYHYHHSQQQYHASSSHQGHSSFHDPAPGQLMTYQDNRATSHAAYHDHARYLAEDSALQDMLGHQIKVEVEPYSRSSMGSMRYGSDSGRSLHGQQQKQQHQQHEHQQQQQHEQGCYAHAGDLQRRTFYNPLVETHVGRHVDPLRSVDALQGMDPLTTHPPHAPNHELRTAGTYLSLKNRYSI